MNILSCKTEIYLSVSTYDAQKASSSIGQTIGGRKRGGADRE
jgi:hypothetical protein